MNYKARCFCPQQNYLLLPEVASRVSQGRFAALPLSATSVYAVFGLIVKTTERSMEYSHNLYLL